jgi:GntR family transcriptional regulator / MocR family aminotransferase
VAHLSEPVLASGPGLLVPLERGSRESLHEQLEAGLREQIRSGQLPPGARLPSSRALASELGISRGVVLEAYSQLTAEGYLSASQGAPTRVATAPSTERPPVPASTLQPRYAYSFDPGLPELAAFPRERWLRCLRLALRDAPFHAMAQGDPRGTAELRNGLMQYLGRVRGAAPEPEHTIVCAGFAQGFALLCRALRDRGVERIAVEEPGWAQHRLIAERAGLRPVAVPVDREGLDVSELAACGCEAVVVTPAHQFPTGVVLSSERRSALLEWAEEEDALVVEDDYDSELRYDRDAIGSLQGLAPERVVHLGSLSKRLAPGLRIGWILSPSWLTGALTYEKALSDGGSPVLEQLALVELIERGELDRHLRRMRLRYRERRRRLIGALEQLVPHARASGIAAGLFVYVELPGGLDAERLSVAAASRGVDVEVGSDGALTLGFANLQVPAIAPAVSLLAQAIAAM